ncbi:MAG: serine/threonine-protein phosphatase [Verrucomicrobia bacterium]|nr:serine/threonine-protein phosphatase [Verrucomicrobiota bacterium]
MPLPPTTYNLQPVAQRLRWSAHTDCGRVRTNNEDSFLGLVLDEQDVRLLGKIGEAPLDRGYIFAVCDGLGGAKAGEFASRIAVEKITKMFPSYITKSKLPHEEETTKTTQLLIELFTEIHRALLLLSASYDECRGMGTTLTLCWIRQHHCYFAHIGDSRLYHLPFAEEASKKTIQQLSEDDTHVGWLFRKGKISEREAKHHQGRNLLQKALGAEHQFVTPQVSSFACAPGDRLLLCTDGVTDGLFDHQLLDIIADAIQDSPARYLVEEATRQSGRDNATAIVLEFE